VKRKMQMQQQASTYSENELVSSRLRHIYKWFGTFIVKYGRYTFLF
jgi:hypothetical protein